MPTHNAEQPMRVVTLFFRIHSVSQGGHDLTGWGRTPSAALTALTLQLGVAPQDHPLELVWQRNALQSSHSVVHLKAIQWLHSREDALVRFPIVIGLSNSRHKHKAHLAFTLTGLKRAVLTAVHHYGFIRRNASSVVQPTATFTLAPAITKGIAVRRPVSCMRWSWRSFGALHKSNVNRGVWWGRRAAIEYSNIVISSNILIVESLQLRGIWRKEELFQRIGQSRAWLNLSDIFRSERKLMLTWPLGGFTLWDTAKTWKPNMGWLVKWLPWSLDKSIN